MGMRLGVMLSLGLLLSCGPAGATCQGQDLIATMSLSERSALDAAVAQHPFGDGNLWRATKPGSTIHVVGTLHLFDPRMDQMMVQIGPLIEGSDLILVEADRAEMDALQRATNTRPDLLFRLDGPTLPETLNKSEWSAVSREMTLRGIPPFLASKFQPWYVAMMLGIPACAMPDMALGPSGLDEMIMQHAEATGVPIQALEPYDTVFRAFSGMTYAEQINLIRAGLIAAQGTDDMFATVADAYFRGEHRQIWEFSRSQAENVPGADPARMRADFALLEDALLKDRNLAWMEPMLQKSEGQVVLVAVGAAHLSGDLGVLNLLAKSGYELTRLPL